jgi:hypothetical protein
MESVKTEPHSKEFRRFDATIGKLLTIPRDVYQARLAAWKAEPGTRGPQRKVKQSPAASHGPADQPQS